MDHINDNELGLTTEQMDKVLQFQDLTGIEDMTVCRDVLQRHQWDLEVAVQEQLNIREGRPSVFATTESRPPAVINDHNNQRIFSSPAGDEPPIGIRGLFGYVVNLLMSFCYNTASSVLSALLNIFRGESRPIVTDPLADVASFIQRFREQYGSEPVFYQGTYAQAVNDAKQELRFLLVYLHSDNQSEAAAFCRSTLSNPTVARYISTHMLLWGCNIESPEGWRVAHSLTARRYPLCALVALRDHRMTVVARMEGCCPPSVFQQRLESLIADNEIFLTQARADRFERNLTQHLRAQQDEAYEESLRADQEKERIRELDRQVQRDKENEEKQRQLAEIQRKEKIARDKVEGVSRVPEEPPHGCPGALSVVIKLPCGTRLERRFLASHSVEDVYYYVFCHPASPDSFEITTNFPKRVLEVNLNSGTSMTLAEAGLKNREVLFVNDLDA